MNNNNNNNNNNGSAAAGRFFLQSLRLVTDLAVLSIAYWLAFLLRFEFDIQLAQLKLLLFTWPYVVFFKYAVLVLFRVPAMSWRYVGLGEAQRIFAALVAATAVLGAHRRALVLGLSEDIHLAALRQSSTIPGTTRAAG